MATYPEGNPGVYPLDPATSVGQFRLLVGDRVAEPYSPDVPGFANYVMYSDQDIEGFLVQAGDSISRAVGFSYLYLASQAAMESVSIKDYDLQVDKTKRAADLRALAQIWLARADTEDQNEVNEAFEIVNTGTSSGEFIPELGIPIWGREYTIGRWR